MKKCLLFVVILAVFMMFTACAPDDPTPVPPAPTPAPTPITNWDATYNVVLTESNGNDARGDSGTIKFKYFLSVMPSISNVKVETTDVTVDSSAWNKDWSTSGSSYSTGGQTHYRLYYTANNTDSSEMIDLNRFSFEKGENDLFTLSGTLTYKNDSGVSRVFTCTGTQTIN